MKIRNITKEDLVRIDNEFDYKKKLSNRNDIIFDKSSIVEDDDGKNYAYSLWVLKI